ncbi:MAG: ABC transporter ATP-binding protein [Marmoricola sp.]
MDSLEVGAGEHVSVLGPNGAGKTTLLRLFAGVETPTAGEVRLDGTVSGKGGVALRRRVAFATQRSGLLSTSVRRNVELPLRWRKVPRAAREQLVMAALERLKVAELADRPAQALSGGQQQRVNLARALAIEPEVLLLDEPAAGLDAESRAAFFVDLEDALADRSATVVHVSHQTDEALRLADRVVVLVEGRVRQVGTPEELSRGPADASVAALVGYDNVVDALIEADGSVLVGLASTGLRSGATPGPARVAVFANGVRLLENAGTGRPGLRVRVARVRPDRGRTAVSLTGPVSLLAHLPIDRPAPAEGAMVGVGFDPALSAVLPTTGRSATAEPSADDDPRRLRAVPD